MFEPPSVLSNLDMEEYQEGPLREICILPFPLEDTLIQGETKELCLYEERCVGVERIDTDTFML